MRELDRAAVAAGEYYRLLSITLVHLDLTHVALNTFSLVVLGSMVEPLLGRLRFLSLYLVCALGASAASLLAGTELAVGASGAIFGLSGALISIASARRLGTQRFVVMTVAGLVVAAGLYPAVDTAGHAGGVLTGLVLGAALEWGRRRPDFVVGEAGSVLAVAVVATALVAVGLHGVSTMPMEVVLAKRMQQMGVKLDVLLLYPPVVDPVYRTTESGRVTYDTYAMRDPARARTIQLAFGDGSTATASVARGSGWARKSMSHRFPPTLARYRVDVSYVGAEPDQMMRVVTDVCPAGVHTATADDLDLSLAEPQCYRDQE